MLTLTQVDHESMTDPEETFLVEVDNLEINMYMIDNWCFDWGFYDYWSLRCQAEPLVYCS
jgi:hypothetical protein